jgi:hypothetical protein
MISLAVLLLLTFDPTPQPATTTGTVCRENRQLDRIVLNAESGNRIFVKLGDNSAITFDGRRFDREDIRPGDAVRVSGTIANNTITADAVEVRPRVANAIVDALFPSSSVYGRFGVQEAKTEYFSLRLPGGDYARVDAKSAYGPKGRVYVSTLKSGDLLELRGKWPREGLLQASYIRVMTNEEPSSCRTKARRGEDSEATKRRETEEQRFLDRAD